MINITGIYTHNMRDAFTAGGQGQIIWKKKTYSGIPKVIIKMVGLIDEIKSILNSTGKEILCKYWGLRVTNKTNSWIDLVEANTQHMRLPLDLKAYLRKKCEDWDCF